MRHGGIIWGGLLILLGVLLLLNRLGVMVTNTWGVFWSAALVLWGLSMLAGAFRQREPEPHNEALALQLKGFEDAAVTLHFDAGRLTLGDGAASDELLGGEFRGGVEHRLNPDGETARVELRSPQGVDDGREMEWDIALNEDIPMTLDLHTGAAESVIDLTRTQVRRLVVSAGAGRTELWLPKAAGETEAVIEGGAGAILVRVPDGAAALITGGTAAGALRVDGERFLPDGTGYRSADYESAANRVTIEVRSGAGEVEVV